MSAPKQTVDLSGPALDFVRSLVEQGEYGTLSDAVSGILEHDRERRVEERQMLEREVLNRAKLPLDQWIWTDSDTYFEDRFRKKHGMEEGDT